MVILSAIVATLSLLNILTLFVFSVLGLLGSAFIFPAYDTVLISGSGSATVERVCVD